MSAARGERARLAITVEPDGDALCLVVAGEIDMASADQLEQAIANALAQRPTAIVVDLTGVAFLDSSGIGALLRGRRSAEIRGARLVVSNPQPPVRTILTLSGVFDFLTGTKPE